MLRRSPGFTAVAVLTLALGIGANTAMFSLVNGVLLKPLPYRNPDGIVRVWETFVSPQGRGQASLCLPRLTAWRQQNQVFEAMAVYRGQGIILKQGDRTLQLGGVAATGEMFSILGVRPLLGRTFAPGEDQPGHNRVAVLSHGLWQRRFGADPEIAGKKIALQQGDFTVIGVMPAWFTFPYGSDSQLWIPMVLPPSRAEGHAMHEHVVLARLRRGVAFEQAQARMETLTRALEKNTDPKIAYGVLIKPLLETYVGWIRPVLLVLFGAVGFVLLIGCANISNLLLARAAGRRVEISIRAAMGASRARLVRQFLVESLLFALAGAALGLVLSLWLLDLVKLSPTYIPRLKEVRVDLRVLGFCAGASILSTLIFGLAPALQATKLDLQQSLKEAGRAGTAFGRGRLRGAIVVGEVGLTLVLLIGAGLMLRSLVRLQQIDPGFRPEQILTLRLSLPVSKYADDELRAAFYQRLLEQIEGLPGVASVGMTSRLPPEDWGTNGGFVIAGRPEPRAGEAPFAEFRFISPNYFRAMGIPLKKGRFLTEQDRKGSPGAAVINESLARRYWPNEDPIGAQIRMGPLAYSIVGVVGDVRNTGLASKPQPEMSFSYLQNPWPSWKYDVYLVLRTALEPNSMAAAVRAEVGKLDPGQPVSGVRTMQQRLSDSTAQPRFRSFLIGSFAGLALLLALIGLYGVISFDVNQRTHEIGVRMALGAERRQVLGMVLRQAFWLAAFGVALGVAGGLAVTRVITSLLFETSATDPATFAGISLVLIAVALLAAWIPARRATRVDPIAALRYE